MNNITNKNSKKKSSILFVCPFPYNQQAGQRLKFEQYFNFFFQNNLNIDQDCFYNYTDYQFLFKKGYFFRKFFAVIKGYIKRLLLINKLKNYDVIYIFMWVSPYFGSSYEKIYRYFSKKIILDLEDNIFLLNKNNINPISYYLKSFTKFNYLIKTSDKIITSSPYLINNFNKITNKTNTTFISSSINLKRYQPIKIHRKNNPIIIGWTGTITSRKYIKIIEPILKRMSEIRNIKFLVIGNFHYQNKNISVESIQWNIENEIKDLSRIDIGLYPVYDDKWSIGKSGLKALQYMALGIPPICSNVGTNKDIINNFQNGFLANDENDWFEHLLKLIDSEDLRSKIGINAKKTIVDYYSTDVIGSQYLKVIESVI